MFLTIVTYCSMQCFTVVHCDYLLVYYSMHCYTACTITYVLSTYLIVVVHKCNEEWGVGDRCIGGFVQIHLSFIEPLLQHLQITIL